MIPIKPIFITKRKIAVITAVFAVSVCLCHAALAVDSFSSEKAVPVPAVMYHSIVDSESRAGKYVVTPEILESDLEYFKNQGYETVFASEVIEHIEGKKHLPNKPLLITFDDGHLNFLTYALPLFEKYGMKANLAIVGSYSEKADKEKYRSPAYSYLSGQEIKEIAESGYVQIGDHSYDMHDRNKRKGVLRKYGEDKNTYFSVFKNDIGKNKRFILSCCGSEPCFYAFPFGDYDADSLMICREMGYKAAFSCEEKVTSVCFGENEPVLIGRYNRSAFLSVCDLFG